MKILSLLLRLLPDLDKLTVLQMLADFGVLCGDLFLNGHFWNKKWQRQTLSQIITAPRLEREWAKRPGALHWHNSPHTEAWQWRKGAVPSLTLAYCPLKNNALQRCADIRLLWDNLFEATGPDYAPVGCPSQGMEVLAVSNHGKMLIQRRETRARHMSQTMWGSVYLRAWSGKMPEVFVVLRVSWQERQVDRPQDRKGGHLKRNPRTRKSQVGTVMSCSPPGVDVPLSLKCQCHPVAQPDHRCLLSIMCGPVLCFSWHGQRKNNANLLRSWSGRM